MYRRELLATTGSVLAVATAGCLGLNQGSKNTPQPDVTVEADFSLTNGDLIVTHREGDVLQSGETIQITAGGEKLTEKTLDENIYAGGEIIRVSDAKCDIAVHGNRVGIYILRQGNPEELDTGDLGLIESTPAVQIAFDYDASVTGPNTALTIAHDGGARLTSGNTGKLSISGNVDSVSWRIGNSNETGQSKDFTGTTDSITAGDTIATIKANSISSGSTIELVWHSSCGETKQVIASWSAPS